MCGLVRNEVPLSVLARRRPAGVDDDEAAARAQRAPQVCQQRSRSAQFVEGVGDQGSVDVGRKVRVSRISMDQLEVVSAGQQRTESKEDERQLASIHRNDPAFLSDQW